MIDNNNDKSKILYESTLQGIEDPNLKEKFKMCVKEEDARLVIELFDVTLRYFQERYTVTDRGKYKCRTTYNTYRDVWQVLLDCEKFIRELLKPWSSNVRTFKHELYAYIHRIVRYVVDYRKIAPWMMSSVLRKVAEDMCREGGENDL